MKKIKLTLGLLVIVFVTLVIYQNRTYFFTKQPLSLSLGVETWNWTAPDVENVVYFGGSLVIGFLIAGYLGLVSKFRSMKTIKHLNKTIVAQIETIDSLKNELDNFKNDPYLQDDTQNSQHLLIETGNTSISENTSENNVNLNKA
ncbi:MAG: hypothetical protein HQK67_11570 [Desulfamplus sp.]|nr:hypothetical protein [Desulfamplus sp.]